MRIMLFQARAGSDCMLPVSSATRALMRATLDSIAVTWLVSNLIYISSYLEQLTFFAAVLAIFRLVLTRLAVVLVPLGMLCPCCGVSSYLRPAVLRR